MFDKRLFKLVSGCPIYIVGVVLFRWIALLSNVGLIAFLSLITRDIVINTTNFNALPVAYLYGLVATIVVRTFALYISQRIADALAHRAKATITSKVYDKLLDLGPAYSEAVSASEAMQTSVEGATQLEVYYGGYLPQFMYAFLAPLTLFALLVPFAGMSAAILMLLVPLIPVSIVFIQKPARRAAKTYWANYVDLGGSFLEAVSGLVTLKIFQADEAWHQKINREAEGFRKTTMQMLTVQLSSIAIMDLFAYFGAAVGIMVALWSFSVGRIDFVAAFLIVFLSQEFFLPLRQLGSLFHAGMSGLAASRRMYAILDAKPQTTGTQVFSRTLAPLCVSNVSYTYGERAVLNDISLEFPQTGLIGLVGESGSGKSTLAGILSGRRLSYKGSLTYNGIDYRDIAPSSLMQAVTYVGTDAHLFAGTVRDNLKIAAPYASDAELYDALKAARIDEFIQAKGGLDFALKEGATNISGGQAQRLSLARALLHDSRIYIFDEATSNIDAASEHKISDVIAELAKNHLVIVVAHRLSLIKDARTIYVLKQGLLKEAGSHRELLAKCGIYKHLWESQSELAEFALSKGFDIDDVAAATPEEEDPESLAKVATNQKAGIGVLLRLLGLVRPLMGYLLLAVILGVVGNLLAMAIPSLGAVGMMRILAPQSFSGISLLAILIALGFAGVLRGPARYAEQLLNHFIAFKLLAYIRDLLFTALRKLAPAKLQGRQKGDVVSLVTSDVELLEVFYAHTISPILIALGVCGAVVAGIALLDSQLALIATAGYAAVGFIAPFVFGIGLTKVGERVRLKNGQINAFVLDQLRGIFETMQYGQEAKASDMVAQQTSSVTRDEDRLKKRAALSEALVSALVSLVSLGVLVYAFKLAQTHIISFEMAFIAGFTYFSSFGAAIAVARLGTSLQQTIASGARVLALLDEKPETLDIVDGEDILFEGAQVRNLSFSYEDTKVLDSVSVNFPEGSITCVVGKSGSGKSTLLKLLMRFWEATQGSITFSHTDINRINTASLRANEAYMTQDTYLFDTTIKENLLMVKPNATAAQIRGAIKSAHLEDFVAALPDGLNTKVGDLGSSLSGGERQRLGLARIFLYNAPFILLDEPTSNLDALSEAAVMKSISEARSGKTIVLVSHRASTAAFADQFVSIEHGRIS